MRKEERIYLLLFLGPCLIFIFILRIAPLFYTLGLSFTSLDLLRGIPAQYVGLENYQRLFQDSRFIHALRVTTALTGICVSGTLFLGLPMALLLDQRFLGQRVCRTLFLLPMFVAPVAVATTWFILFHVKIGPINYLLKLIGLHGPEWLNSPFFAFLAISVSDVWQWTPFVALLILAGLQNIDVQLYEAAKIDGASNLKLFWHITLPGIREVVLVAIILRSMDAFRIFDKIYVLTMGGPGVSTESISMLAYKVAFRWLQLGYAAAMVIVPLGAITAVYWIFSKQLRESPMH